MSDLTPLVEGLRVAGYVLGAGVGLPLAYRAGRNVYDDLYNRFRTWQHDALTVSAISTQNKLNDVRTIAADERGRYPLLYGKAGILRDPNNLRAFTLRTVLETWPALERLDAIQKTLLAMRGISAPARAMAQLEEKQPPLTLPDTTLGRLLHKHSFVPRLHAVLIGEEATADGQVQPLLLDLPKAVHTIVTGSSGLGKSTLMESMAVQLAGVDGVQLAAVDYGSGTFDTLQNVLAWQIAETPDQANALFAELIACAMERKERWKEAGRIRSLDQYNAKTGEGLPFIVVFCDEVSPLLDHPGTKKNLTELARVGRKYGVGLVLGGTDFKVTTLPSEARSNCQGRLSFWLEPGLSRSLFNSDVASELGRPGDFVLKRPGTPGFVYGHSPLVLEGDYSSVNAKEGTPKQLPAVQTPGVDDDPTLPDDERARRLHAAGLSKRQTALRVFGGDGGAAWRKLENALSSSSTVDTVEPTGKAQSPTTTTPDFCDFCNRDADSMPAGVTFAACAGCGVAVCSDCAVDGLCPDCREGQ